MNLGVKIRGGIVQVVGSPRIVESLMIADGLSKHAVG